MWLTKLITACFLLLSTTGISLAEDNTDNKAQTVNTPLNSSALLETILGLILVLGLILALAWLIKRTGRFQTSANGDIKMIAGLSLGPRERAVLLEVEGERLLVGVTAQNINTLHVLGQNTPSTRKDQDKYGQFDQQLQQLMDEK